MEHEWVRLAVEEPTAKRILGFKVEHYVCINCGAAKVDGVVKQEPLTSCVKMWEVRETHEWPDPMGALSDLADILRNASIATDVLCNPDVYRKILETKTRIPVSCRACGAEAIYHNVNDKWIVSYNKTVTCAKVRMENALGK